MPHRRQRRRPVRRGATAVEFAIVAPVFFMVLLAMFEFTRLNVLRHTADNAAYEAARAAMVPGATADDARDAANLLLRVAGARGATVDPTPAVITTDTEEVSVAISVPLDQNGWVVPKFTRGRTLTSRSTLRTERVQTR
ncbi:TadE family protein [Botrimarina sp.]|uniref:TadE family protein n=1 Tax=Botrimarina sp. TaxID=2795802 RepID=UPI0032ECD369